MISAASFSLLAWAVSSSFCCPVKVVFTGPSVIDLPVLFVQYYPLNSLIKQAILYLLIVKHFDQAWMYMNMRNPGISPSLTRREADNPHWTIASTFEFWELEPALDGARYRYGINRVRGIQATGTRLDDRGNTESRRPCR